MTHDDVPKLPGAIIQHCYTPLLVLTVRRDGDFSWWWLDVLHPEGRIYKIALTPEEIQSRLLYPAPEVTR